MPCPPFCHVSHLPATLMPHQAPSPHSSCWSWGVGWGFLKTKQNNNLMVPGALVAFSSCALCLAALSVLRPHLPLPFRLLHPSALSRLLSFRTWPGCFSAKLQDWLLVQFQAPAWLSPCQCTLPDLPSSGSPFLPVLLSHLCAGLCEWVRSLPAPCFLPPPTPKPRAGTQWLRSPHTLSVVFRGLDPLL